MMRKMSEIFSLKVIRNLGIIFVVIGCFGLILAVVKSIPWLVPVAGPICIGGLFMVIGYISSVTSMLSRPIVYVWKHHDMTRLLPGVDFEIERQLQARLELAGIGPIRRPDSPILIQFTDDPDYKCTTGRTEDYKKLIRGCDVREIVMQIHPFTVCNLPFPVAWKLVHGPDAKPPEKEEKS